MDEDTAGDSSTPSTGKRHRHNSKSSDSLASVTVANRQEVVVAMASAQMSEEKHHT